MVGGFNRPGERTAGTGSAGRGDAGVSTTYLFSSPRSFRPRWADHTTGSLMSFGSAAPPCLFGPRRAGFAIRTTFSSSFRRQGLYELYALPHEEVVREICRHSRKRLAWLLGEARSLRFRPGRGGQKDDRRPRLLQTAI